MHILIATGIFPPDIGGPATYSKLLADELVKRGHDIDIITYCDDVISNFQFPIFKFQNSKFKIKKISRKMPKGVRHLAYFWNMLRAGARADIIYAQDAVSAGFPAMIAARILRKQFFLKVVGDHAWEQGMQRFGVTDLLDNFLAKSCGMRIALLRFFQTQTAKHAEKIIVPSAYLKSVVERWGVSSERIAVIPNAISLPDTIPAKKEARNTLGVEGFLLVTAGRLVPWKGFEMLVELMPDLIDIIPRAKLVVIGDGPEKKLLELRIKNYELGDRVLLTGSVSKDRVAMYLAAADVFLLNTGYEGFSHQLIEAMAIGTSIITTDAGGNKEVVRDGENALFARYNDPADWKEKILRLYADTELQTKLAKPRRDIMRIYSVEAMINKTKPVIFHS